MPASGPVVLFAGGLAGDGVARNTVHLANALARRGVPVEIVCLKGGALAAELAGPAVTCLGRGRGARALALAAAVPALHRRLKALAPSVVLSMGNHGHLACWAALRGLPDTPRLYRISNDPAHGGTAQRWVRGLGLRLVAADATRLICVSAEIAAAGPFRRARRDGRVRVLPNGVDADAVRERAARPVRHPWLSDGRPYLVSVGRLHRQKNYEGLIEAISLARRERPDLRLLVLGGGPPKARRALEACAGAAGLAAAVRFEGEVANPFPLVAAAQAYVLPSLWEGASNSLLEAMACGVPVVASRTAGAAAAVLEDGRHGLLADPASPPDLARAILVQTDPATRIGPGGRVAAFRLDATLARLCAAVASARLLHDENQMLAERAPHLARLSETARGQRTE
ncbi:MAG: glycosyltransferase [Phenylobacterium sp.]|uniref:glycosyltransferase n=1 Tax=Phenylobacterium sp. TaxID=1871053 RepID=UPI001A53216D|nr:glycosyltransferase [Phenylobacterium sp.]MBL8553060.1 glycosyltransferase [Phenylobacterium sp.]